jgi:hypothetical protein
MRAVWASRQEELLSDCLVSPHIFAHMVDRLRAFVVPYQHCLETEADKAFPVHRRKNVTCAIISLMYRETQ